MNDQSRALELAGRLDALDGRQFKSPIAFRAVRGIVGGSSI
jgi:hypothetical protein